MINRQKKQPKLSIPKNFGKRPTGQSTAKSLSEELVAGTTTYRITYTNMRKSMSKNAPQKDSLLLSLMGGCC